jgi:Uma2 family endonuclease
MSTITQLTAEEFAVSVDAPRHSELVGGRVLELTPPGYEHGSIQVAIGSLLRAWARRTDFGGVVSEVGFILSRDPDTVRAPDVAFVRRERLPSPRPRGYIEGPPDLAVEIRSPSDRQRRLSEAVADYLDAGTPMVWVVDPGRRSVTVHRPFVPTRVYGVGDVLDAGPELPGLRVEVGELLDLEGS